jgi:tRNA(Ile)-lysidine synthase
MHTFTNIHRFCTQHALLPVGGHILVGFSGGPDSTFLLHFLLNYQCASALTISAAHLDHGWRKESAFDAQHCLEYAKKYGIECYVAKAADIPSQKKYNGSREDFARHLRRTFFEQTASAIGADRIALAHHKQDQQETFFIRLLRGTTLTGLTGMHPQNGRYIRPLLETDRTTIMAYMTHTNIPYLTDATNDSENYLRNRIRKHVIPALRLVDERFDTTFAKTVSHLHETEDFLTMLTQRLLSDFTECSCETTVLNCAQLKTMHPAIQKRIILAWLCIAQVPFSPSNALLAEIIRFLQTPGNKEHQLATTWALVKNKDHLWVKLSYDTHT